MSVGLKACKPARKPRLTPLMKKKRLALPKITVAGHQRIGARCYFRMNPQCSNFLFGCNMFGAHLEKHTAPTVKHPPSQMVWGAMSAAGTGGHYFLTPGATMNGEKYVKVLQEKLQLHMIVHQCDIFMHDGAPCHRS